MGDNATVSHMICYNPTKITTNGIWQGENPLEYSLPLFLLQLILVVAATRLFVFILRPFHQPRVVAEILGGLTLGPTLLGRNQAFATTVFPLRGTTVLETMANVGLLYFMFMLGLETDVLSMKRIGRKAVAVAVASTILPLGIGVAFSYIVRYSGDTSMKPGTHISFLAVAFSVTAFPVLARILAELKLINSEIGRLALSSAIVSDMFSWFLLAFSIALADNETSSLAAIWVVLSTAVFVAFSIFVIRPCVSWVIRRTPEGESFNDFYICVILAGVMISGFITDALGTHSVFGGFVFGLVIPSGPLTITLIEKLEDFISGLLLPLYFAISGLKTDISAIKGTFTWAALIFVILLACVGKVAGTVVIALFYHMSIREGITLGLLMNTKGLIEMIVLNVGVDQKFLDEESFAIMVMITIVMTAVVVPGVSVINKPSRRLISYKRRTIELSKQDTELRVLVCIHTPRNVPTIINLIDASNPTKKSPICIYVLHLVELSGRTSAMLIVHNTRKPDHPALNRTQAQSDHIINAFENYEQHSGCVSVQPLTAISPYSTMHEDICNLAEDKRVAFIIIPFHKQQTIDGGMEPTNMAFRLVNQNVLVNAPCSVGILVDRSLTGANHLSANQTGHQVALLFFGGPDDREALSYAWRMSEHPGINLTLVHFLPGEEAAQTIDQSQHFANPGEPKRLTVETDNDIEKKLDERCLHEFRMHHENDDSVLYIERVVNNGEETVGAIRAMDDVHDLFIVGRGQGMISALTAGLTDWSECPELGAIGDLLASSDFGTSASVLVIQQYVGYGSQLHGENLNTPSNGDDANEEYRSNHSTRTPPTRGQNVYQQQQL
ncbi:hypothetical protein L6164_023751 [Bauhinia variegata]|uniref:Uncharacterized protein n=1 Tax=Bauhinia variegata TaxID=167791 RepID=A0ACB9MJR5_BAUVA|nr:hypothetical protein L6164_023751 [Bauhinia variegata]